MLSSILSWLFRLAFVMLVLSGIINIIVQVQQHPIIYRKTQEGSAWLGRPGIQASATRTTNAERNAPDTTVIYSIRSGKDSSNIGSGNISFKAEFKRSKERTTQLLATQKAKGNIIQLDTQVNLLLHRNWDLISREGDYISKSPEVLADGRVVYKSSTINGKTNATRFTTKDTFRDMNAANIFGITNDQKHRYRMAQEGTVTETILLKPVDRMQHILFVLYYVVLSGSIALLMLALSRLFRNFEKREYFTLTNVKQLGNIGWLLLIPQILQAVLYWTYLAWIQPVKIILSNAAGINEAANYQFISGIEWQLVFFGLGILILSYIFKNGLAVKEAHALII